MVTGPVILRSSSTEKLVGNEIVVGVGGTTRRREEPFAVTVTVSWAGVSVTSPATSTRRIESSRWQAAVAAARLATATKTGSRMGADRARRTLRTCNCPASYRAAIDRAGETPGSPRR